MATTRSGFAVLGLSRFSYRTAQGLYEAGAHVIAVDQDPSVVQRIAPHVTKAVEANAMDLDVLEHVGVFDTQCVVIGFRSAFEASVLLAHHLRTKTGVERILAQADTQAKAEALRRLGVDQVVIPEVDIADRVVRRLTLPDLLEHFPLGSNAAILEVAAPADFVGRTLTDLGVRARYGVHVLGIRHAGDAEHGDEMVIAPAPQTRFRAGDTMLLLGATADLQTFQDRALRRRGGAG